MREENIEKMDFKELRKEVQLLRDELAIFKRKYEDAIYNLDSGNFGKSFAIEYGNMKTAIKITANGLESTVSKTDLATELVKYSTIEQTAEAITATVTTEYVDTLIGGTYVTNAVMQSGLKQTSDSILLSVKGEYETKEEAETKKTNLESSIETSKNGILATVRGTYQTKSDAEDDYELLEDAIASLELTVDGLTSTVSKNISAYFESTIHPNRASGLTDEQKSMLCLYGDTYYYYNDSKGAWEEYPAEGLKTMFRQTATGFELTGDVSISGDLVSGGTIMGTTVSTNPNIYGDGVQMNADNQCFEVVYGGTAVACWGAGNFGDSHLTPVNNGTLLIEDATPTGTWDFSECEVEGLTAVAVFG